MERGGRSNSGNFEEWGGDNFERECVEEYCSTEELKEIHLSGFG